MDSEQQLTDTVQRSANPQPLYSLATRITVILAAMAFFFATAFVFLFLGFQGYVVSWIAEMPTDSARDLAEGEAGLFYRLTAIYATLYGVSLISMMAAPVVLTRHMLFTPLRRLTFAVRDGNTDILHDIARRTQTIEMHTMIASFAGLMDEAADQRRELHRKVEDQTAQLEDAQQLILRQEKLASLGQLAAGVAHEINNPSAFIMGNLEVLNEYITVMANRDRLVDEMVTTLSEEPSDLPRVRESVEALQRFDRNQDMAFILADLESLVAALSDGMKRITTIVKGLNSFARPAGGDPEEIDLNVAIDNAVQIVWNQLKYDYTLYQNISGHFATWALPGQIEQVVINLLLNARDASPAGSEIQLELYERGGMAVIAVTDFGEGIPPDQLERIFDPFFTTKPAGAGTGLGLSISHEIVVEAGGSIHVESTVGESTRFEVVLPNTPFTVEELA